MKKVSLFILISFFAFSCSKENDNEEPEQNELLGKWFYVSEKYDEEEIVSTDCDTQQYFEFFSNGSISIKFVDTRPCDFSILIGDYNVSGSTLEITGLQGSDDLNYSFDIVNFSNSSLILEDEIMDEGEISTYRLQLVKE